MPDESDDLKLTSKTKIRNYGLLAVLIVFIYEILKASHHSVFVGFNRPIEWRTIDWETTGFWFFDTIVAGIVTFALIYIAFRFERLETILDQRGRQAQKLSDRFDTTTEHLGRLQAGLTDTKFRIDEVVRSIVAAGGTIEKLNSKELWEILEKNPTLESSFLQNLKGLTTVWSDLILAEGKSTSTSIAGKNYGLLCWSAVIDKYLKEEVEDIHHRILATNIKVYVQMIETIVDKVLAESEHQGARIELFATAVLLPVEYYNWKEYKPGEDDPYVRLSGTSLAFMDGYRAKIQEWLRHPSKRLTLKRVLLVADRAALGEELQIQLNDLAIQPLDQLRKQARLNVLCNIRDEEPRTFRIGLAKNGNVDEIGHWVELDRGFPELHKDEYAYAIMRDFKNHSQFSTADLKEIKLLEVFKRQLHSQPHKDNALCLIFNNDNYSTQLEYLPTVLGGSDGTRNFKCPDFLAVRLIEGTSNKLIACIATRLKPNYDTMTLRLITEAEELARIQKFIEFASSSNVTKSLDEVVAD